MFCALVREIVSLVRLSPIIPGMKNLGGVGNQLAIIILKLCKPLNHINGPYSLK